VGEPGRCCVRELVDRIDDPKLDRRTGEVTDRSELINPPDGFRPSRVAVPSEHQVSGAPDVDLGYHAERVNRAELETFKTGSRSSEERRSVLTVPADQAIYSSIQRHDCLAQNPPIEAALARPNAERAVTRHVTRLYRRSISRALTC
jgi:hypothetical protein